MYEKLYFIEKDREQDDSQDEELKNSVISEVENVDLDGDFPEFKCRQQSRLRYNNYLMHPNYCWQSFGFNYINPYPVSGYFDNFSLSTISESKFQQSIQELRKKCELLSNQNSRLKEQIEQMKANSTKRKKKRVKRRKEEQLERDFKCNYAHCKKEYGSLLALNLHVKRKHGVNSTSNEKQSLPSTNKCQLKPQHQIESSG